MKNQIETRFTQHLRDAIDGKSLSRKDAEWCLIQLLDHKLGVANDVCFGALFSAMQTRAPHREEVAGLMDAVMNHDRKKVDIKRNFSEPLCGIIGSGKDDLHTFNVSSISSVVASAAGAYVLKNGSRAEASVAGTTDVFEELGLPVLDSNTKRLERSVNNLRFGFCDAEPYFPKMVKEYLGKFFFVHPLSYILPVASGLSFERVVFGLATDETEQTAELLVELGYDNSLVVAGHDTEGRNFDELSTVGPTKISQISNRKVTTYWANPEDFGLDTSSVSSVLEGNSVAENAQIFSDIIKGIDVSNRRDIVLLNTGALLYVSGVVDNISEGVRVARNTIDNGTAGRHFEKIRNF